jgi:HSP20 family protein
MTLARWNPFREMEEILDRVNRNMAGRPRLQGDTGQESMAIADWIPQVDISETDDEYRIKMEIPEVNKEDVNVSLNQGVLMIQGERRSENEEKGEKFHRVERAFGQFARSFTLPDDVDDEGVSAKFKDGMLYLSLKKSEKAKPKSIQINVS